jgi:co-chaperonin GroES (HSP10)
MSKTYIEPATDQLLVVDSPREVSIDGIELPGNVRQQEMCFGTVVFVGPKTTATKPEDLVCYGPYAGKNVVIDGIEFRLLREGQIEAYIRKTQ